MSDNERSQIIGQIRRKLSTAFMRAVATCTLHRVTHVGAGSKAAAKRREWAMGEEFRMRNERRAYWAAYVRGAGARGGNGGIHFFPP